MIRSLSPDHRPGSFEDSAAQMRLAQATIEARQAELLLREVARDVMALRDDAQPVDRARWAASITHVVHEARRVIQDVAEASGASAHFLDQPLQRAARDANVASCHIAFDRDGSASSTAGCCWVRRSASGCSE